MFQKAIKEGGNKDFEYGTLPSLMKLKAIQEKEMRVAQDNRNKKNNMSAAASYAQAEEIDSEENIEAALKLNSLILERSKDASLVITNLPPILDG